MSQFLIRFAILDSCANQELRTSYPESSRGSCLAGQKTEDSTMTDFSIILQRHTAVPQHSMVILISCKRLYARNKTNSHLNIPTHTYNTRSQSSFINPCSKGNIYVNSFFPRTIKDWNALVLNIRKMETLDIFKCTVREQILFI